MFNKTCGFEMYPKELIQIIIIMCYTPTELYHMTQKILNSRQKCRISSGYDQIIFYTLNKVFVYENLMNTFREIKFNNIKKICMSMCSATILTTTGECFRWEYYDRVSKTINLTCPRKIQTSNVVDITRGVNHYIILLESEEIRTWGENNIGQLGLEATHDDIYYTPQQVGKMLPSIISIECGYHSTFVITKNGDAFAWGWNEYGQLGIGEYDNKYLPERVKLSGILSISCRDINTIFLDLNHKVYLCGRFCKRNIPIIMEFPNLKEIIISVKCSIKWLIILTHNGNVFMWLFKYESVHKVNIQNIESIYSGKSYCLGLTKSGNVFKWDNEKDPKQIDLPTK